MEKIYYDSEEKYLAKVKLFAQPAVGSSQLILFSDPEYKTSVTSNELEDLFTKGLAFIAMESGTTDDGDPLYVYIVPYAGIRYDNMSYVVFGRGDGNSLHFVAVDANDSGEGEGGDGGGK